MAIASHSQSRRRPRSPKGAWLGVGAAVLLAATACAPASGAPKANATAGSTVPRSGGTVVDALTPLTGMDWYLPLMPDAYNLTVNATAQSLQYLGLYVMGNNGVPDYARSVASDITSNNAGTVYTVRMNPKWHWSNGLPVTASDVEFEWHMIQAASAPTVPAPWPWAGAGPTGLATLVKTFTVVNTHEFRVTTVRAVNQSWFVGQLGGFMPFPKASWDKYPGNHAKELAYLTANGSNPQFFSVTDGPFRLVKAVPEQSWTFLPNPHYDGHKPYLHRLVFQYETTDTAELSGLQTGSIQVGYLPPTSYAIRDTLTLDRFVALPQPATGGVTLDFKNPQVGALLKQLPVRQAMEMGIDQPVILRAIYNGLGVEGVGPVPSMSPYLDPQLKKPVYPFNIPGGIHLLEANGWHLVNGVMTNTAGQKLQFSVHYMAGNSSFLALAQILSQDWAREGIKTSLRAVPFATMHRDRLHPSLWEVGVGGLATGGAMTYTIRNANFETNGPLNPEGYSNPTLDRLMATALGPLSRAAALRADDAYQVFVAHHLPVLWLPVGDSYLEIAKTVHGVLSSRIKGSYAIYPQYWWVGQ